MTDKRYTEKSFDGESEGSLNLQTELFALLDKLNCKYEEHSGIIYVTTPEGRVWDFTKPLERRLDAPPDTHCSHGGKNG